jgi:hypothetical protein
MRILGYLDHPYLKITVFKTDTRLSIKVENGQLEQTYKFRPDDRCNSLREVRELVDHAFLAELEAHFRGMESTFRRTWERHFPPTAEEDDFDVII